MESCTGIPANSDIAGVGVRISIYLQSFLTQVPPVLALVLSKGETYLEPKHLASVQASRYAILTTGFGLLISGVVQAEAYQLTVYHALVMLNLSWIVLITASGSLTFFEFTEPSQSNLERRELAEAWMGSTTIRAVTTTVLPGLTFNHPRYTVKKELANSSSPSFWSPSSWGHGWTCTVHMTFMSAIGIWLFSDITRFDRQTPACTPLTIYPVFGHQVESTSHRLRTFWLVIYIIGTLPVLNVTLLSLVQGPLLFLLFILLTIFTGLLNSLRERFKSLLPLYLAFEEGFYAFYISVIFTTTIFNCFLIASTETMINRNHVQSGENQWTFGQTLSLFLVIPGIWTACRDIQATRKRWREQLLDKDMELNPLQGPVYSLEQPVKSASPSQDVIRGRSSAPGNSRRRFHSV